MQPCDCDLSGLKGALARQSRKRLKATQRAARLARERDTARQQRDDMAVALTRSRRGRAALERVLEETREKLELAVAEAERMRAFIAQ